MPSFQYYILYSVELLTWQLKLWMKYHPQLPVPASPLSPVHFIMYRQILSARWEIASKGFPMGIIYISKTIINFPLAGNVKKVPKMCPARPIFGD